MRQRTVPSTSARPPTDERPTAPPPKGSLWTELTGAREVVRLVGRVPRLRAMPKGRGELVVVIPGWLAPEWSLAPLVSYLRRLGYNAQSWGLGAPKMSPPEESERLQPHLDALVARTGQSAHLVGWSLGGVIARETAREMPERVAQVIAFGSPFIGGPLFTAVADRFPLDDRQSLIDRIETLERERPVKVPVTSIFSRRDGVVEWRASMDHYSAQTLHVEVNSTHFSLGLDPDVWEAVARQLDAGRTKS